MNKKILIFSIIFIVMLLFFLGIYFYNREYTYICVLKDLEDTECITLESFTTCNTKDKLDKNVLTNISDLKESDKLYYCYNNDKYYNSGDVLYEEYFEERNYEMVAPLDIELLNEVETVEHVSSNESIVKYKAYIKNSKLYFMNINTNEEKIMFDNEKVRNIAIRPYCCTGEASLVILTESGNVYMSEQDFTYSVKFKITFRKLNVKNIVSFKIIPKNDDDLIRELYCLDSDGNEYKIEEF